MLSGAQVVKRWSHSMAIKTDLAASVEGPLNLPNKTPKPIGFVSRGLPTRSVRVRNPPNTHWVRFARCGRFVRRFAHLTIGFVSRAAPLANGFVLRCAHLTIGLAFRFFRLHCDALCIFGQ